MDAFCKDWVGRVIGIEAVRETEWWSILTISWRKTAERRRVHALDLLAGQLLFNFKMVVKQSVTSMLRNQIRLAFVPHLCIKNGSVNQGYFKLDEKTL